MVVATPQGNVKIAATSYVRYPGAVPRRREGARRRAHPDVRLGHRLDQRRRDGRGCRRRLLGRRLQAGVQRDGIAPSARARRQPHPGPPRGGRDRRRAVDAGHRSRTSASAGRVTIAVRRIHRPARVSALRRRRRRTGDRGDVHRLPCRPGPAGRLSGRVRREGQPAARARIRTFEFNVPIDAAFFKKPTRKLHCSRRSHVAAVE